MIRVVIVEDETLVRLGLKSCLSTDESIAVTGAFASAEEAEAYFIAHDADVLITDIRLPGVSGLELIHRLRPKAPDMVMIVLSCYEDFSYARTALEYGATRYILKHELNEAALAGMLTELVSESGALPHPRAASYELEKFVRDACASGGAVAGAFCFRGAGESANVTSRDVNTGMLADIIRTILVNYGMGDCFLWRESRLIAVLSSGGKPGMDACFREISQNMRIYLDKNCYMGLSDTFFDPDALEAGFEQADGRCGLSFYYETSALLTGREQRAAQCASLGFAKRDAFTPAWRACNAELINRFFNDCALQKPDVEQLREAVMCYLHGMLSHAEQYFGLDRARAYGAGFEPCYQTVCGFASLAALRGWLLRVVDKTMEYVSSQNDLTNKIREFLAERYCDAELMQLDVADHFHMSGPYFSQFFKESFGVNYIQYLNDMRIESAKRLLRTTNDSTESIACRVGIPNANYFFRLFKKTVGCTVKSYRQQYNKQKN